MTLKRYTAALVPCLMIIVGTAWAWHYVASIRADPRQDDSALALVGPLLWVLVPLAVLTMVQSLAQAARDALPETHGLSNWKRLAYLPATALMLVALQPLGFLISGPVFLIALAWLLGMRNPLVLLGCGVGLAALIYFGFHQLLSVDLPLYPGQRQ